MRDRRLARKLALEILYEQEIVAGDWRLIAKRRLDENLDVQVVEFCRRILKGLDRNRSTIDATIEERTENWALDRLPLIDRNIMRLALYEMFYEPKIPTSVSINEAVELAKEYGGVDSSRFINGVLGQLATKTEEAQ
jgi:N utilization substance protein B